MANDVRHTQLLLYKPRVNAFGMPNPNPHTTTNNVFQLFFQRLSISVRAQVRSFNSTSKSCLADRFYSQTTGQYHSVKGTVVETIGNLTGATSWQQSGREEHASGEAEYNAACAKDYVEGASDRLVGKKEAVLGAVTGDRQREISGTHLPISLPFVIASYAYTPSYRQRPTRQGTSPAGGEQISYRCPLYASSSMQFNQIISYDDFTPFILATRSFCNPNYNSREPPRQKGTSYSQRRTQCEHRKSVEYGRVRVLGWRSSYPMQINSEIVSCLKRGLTFDKTYRRTRWPAHLAYADSTEPYGQHTRDRSM